MSGQSRYSQVVFVSMRRLILLAAILAVVLAGCGSSASKPAADPTASALSFFPAQTPFVMTIATNPNASSIKQAQALEGKFPIAKFAVTALMGRLDALGIDYQNEVRPLFGNPATIGAAGSSLSSSGARSEFLFAWVTKSASKLSALIAKLHIRKAGTRDGAQLYQSAGAALAIDGATMVFGPSIAIVDAALDRHAHGGGVTPAAYASDVSGLPQQASLMTAFGSLTGVLSQPSDAKARRVPWVAAIRAYAASINAGSTGLTVQYHIDTSGTSISPSQLPIAAGTAAPSFVGQLPIDVGVRDPAQVISFVEAAAQITSPASYASFASKELQLKQKAGIDLNRFVALLNGNMVVASDTHTTIARIEVSDPPTAARTLAKLASAPPSTLGKGTSIKSSGAGLYEVKQPTSTLTIGVVGNQFVVGKATPSEVRAFAAAPTTPATGAAGSVAFRVSLPDLLRLTFKSQPSQEEQAILNSLGDLSGWASASPSGLTGSATLGLQ